MDFQTAIRTCLQKYVDINGRASRPEYWWFLAFQVVAIIAAAILDIFVGFLQALVILGLLIPSVTSGVRRLHDVDKSGWWLLLSLVPLFGWVLLLVFLAQRGTDGANRYGEPPVVAEAPAVA